MKKLFAMFAVAVVFASCGSGESKEPAKDSTKVDTVVTPVVIDTTHHDSTKMAPDTTHKM